MVLSVVLSRVVDTPARDSMPQMCHKPLLNQHVQEGRRPQRMNTSKPPAPGRGGGSVERDMEIIRWH